MRHSVNNIRRDYKTRFSIAGLDKLGTSVLVYLFFKDITYHIFLEVEKQLRIYWKTIHTCQ
uniref:Uncharacterized protein n=1 Tax=Setaria italica TaxID=4555 RepID=K3XP47_SETIT